MVAEASAGILVYMENLSESNHVSKSTCPSVEPFFFGGGDKGTASMPGQAKYWQCEGFLVHSAIVLVFLLDTLKSKSRMGIILSDFCARGSSGPLVAKYSCESESCGQGFCGSWFELLEDLLKWKKPLLVDGRFSASEET